MKKKRVKRKDNSQLKEDDLLNKAMKIIDKPADEFQIFGDFVACELRNLQNRENQQRLKRMIQRAILEVAEQDTSRPSSTASYYSSFVSSPTDQGMNNLKKCHVMSYYLPSYMYFLDPQRAPHNTQVLYEQSYTLVSETDTSTNDMNLLQIL